MLRGLYTSATAMMAYSRRMDVVTNNLVNAETVGFKQDTMTTRSFPDMLISRLNDPSIYQYSYVGPHNLGMHVDETFTSFSQGSLEESGRSLDFAIEGDGFFVVSPPPGLFLRNGDEDEEPRYTRAGNFALDAEGHLVTPGGYYVQGRNGDEIQIGSTDFTVNQAGEIYVTDDNGNQEYIDTIRVVRFENLHTDEDLARHKYTGAYPYKDHTVLRKEGDNLYSVYVRPDADDPNDPDFDELAGEPVDVDNARVLQGYLEMSNVDSAKEMVRMMETHRAYEVNQRMVGMFSETLKMTVNDIARF
ncbi:MAG: flagellar hook-basal body protein [Oscillospiraceae bacterium]|nr:flagellar hook-basal body protein [Oscillospiraceae bacterium]